jgi:hypothetical protein
MISVELMGLIFPGGKIEIWAASIIYTIARLNFLFDKANGVYITPDIICDFFNTKKLLAIKQRGLRKTMI